ncbi:MAG: hypothetical protein GF411_02745 [Candidatus Lokiarchaeota archaeon]|nr:hypothetical protein [Candidatus Lokiarchaeota archaeon]
MTSGAKDVPLKVSLLNPSKHIPVKVSILSDGWVIPTTGPYQYQCKYYGTTASVLKIDTAVLSGADDWNDYMMVGYVNLATSPVSANNRIGFVLRYQDTSNYYFVGFQTDTTAGGGKSSYEVYKKASGTYTRIANNHDTGNNDETDPNPNNWVTGIPDTVGSTGVLSAGTQYQMRVDLYGNTCRMYIQNELIYENTTAFSDYTSGEVGLEAYTDSSDDIIAYFDTLKVVS